MFKTMSSGDSMAASTSQATADTHDAVRKEIGRDRSSDPVFDTPKRILVACHDIILSGGLLQFDRVAAVLRGWGHDLSFVTLADTPRFHRPTDVPVLSFEEASQIPWDAVMVPGAGFPEETIARFSTFRHERFGVRVQHILNDQQKRALFKAVNESFAPQIVIFNNDHWPAGSFTEFSADRFHVLVGAVDIAQFRPKPRRARSAHRWIVGGLANKNPGPLIEALNHLGPEVSIRLYGIGEMGLAERHTDLVESGRLQLMGPLFGEENLARFYHGVDCVVATEIMAGWVNLAAEAMASGVPVICTRIGTIAFAHHEKTALLVDCPSPVNLAAGIRRLQADPVLCANLCGRGREVIECYSWDAYTKCLLSIIHRDGRSHNSCAPDLGLFRKWPVDQRVHGLELLLAHAKGASVIEFGAAEGAISRKFLEYGASLLHG